MNSDAFKGYVLTVGFGLVVLAGLIFLLLQWGVRSVFTVYGKPFEASTLWVMLGAVVAGPLYLGAVRLTIRGARILHRSRRQPESAPRGGAGGEN
jgi:hypothetical protein